MSSQRPNILFLVSDQHNAKVLGHTGHPDVKTPNLDRLAREGSRFSRAVVQNPICTPSRVCFTSGQYAHNHGIYQLSGPRPRLPTIFGHFRQHGYTTAAIGKIHCPEYWVEDDCDLFIETAGDCSIGGSPEYLKHISDRGLEDAHRLSELRSGPFGQCLDGYESPLPYRSCP
jgi:arylsulfatase A-like enzyme